MAGCHVPDDPRFLGHVLRHAGYRCAAIVDRYRMPDPLRLPRGAYSDMVSGADYRPPELPYVEFAPAPDR